MLGQIHALVANGARTPPAPVSGSGGSPLFVPDLVGFLAVGASLGRLTKGRLVSVMMRERRVPKEVAVTQVARSSTGGILSRGNVRLAARKSGHSSLWKHTVQNLALQGWAENVSSL